MNFKTRNKISAEFNMASLADVIFLLLIFFMLTSSLIIPNALNLKLPGTSSSITVPSKPASIAVKRDGTYYLNGNRISLINLEKTLSRLKKQMKGRAVYITISPHPKTANEAVVGVLDIAYRYGINAILTEPK